MRDHLSNPHLHSLVERIPLDPDLLVRILVGALAGYALLRVAGAIGSLISRVLAWSVATAIVVALVLGGMPRMPQFDMVRDFVERAIHQLSG